MWFRLASLLGSTVSDLQERMTSDEFTHWIAFFGLEPWGYDAEVWRMGMTCATTANAAGPKKGGKPWRPSDFIPKKRKQSSGGQSILEQRAILEAMVKPHG
jgi:hypothetical protein